MVHLTRLVVEKGQVELVRTDNNASFKNRTYRKFLMANGIRLEHTSPASPESTGMVERVNQTLVGYLRCSVNDHLLPKMNWTKVFKRIVKVYNTSLHRVLGVTPVQALSLLHIANPVLQSSITSRIVNDNLGKLENLNKDRKIVEFDEGEIVYFYYANTPNRGKMDPLLRGPAIFVRQISSTMVEIKYNGKVLNHNVRHLFRSPQEQVLRGGMWDLWYDFNSISQFTVNC